MSVSKGVINEILVELFKEILSIEERALRDKGLKNLSITEVHTIEAIGLDEAKSMSEIADKLKITIGTLSTAINRLVKKGYTQRRRDEDDRRIVLIELTKKGEEAFKVHEEFHEEMVEKMVQDLNIQEDKTLLKSLVNLKNFFKTRYN